MKKTLTIILAVLVSSMICSTPIRANDVEADLMKLLGKVNSRLRSLSITERNVRSNFEEEIKAFDTLLEKYKDGTDEELASIYELRVTFELQVFDDLERARKYLELVAEKYPDTAFGKQAADNIKAINQEMEFAKLNEALQPGKPFPAFESKDMEGGTVNLKRYEGKILLVDFWATWCGPCVAEMPGIERAYKMYHDRGFEVLGVNCDEDRSALKGFLEKKNLPWTQAPDPQGKLQEQFGILKLPTTFLVDGEGKIIARDVRSYELPGILDEKLPK